MLLGEGYGLGVTRVDVAGDADAGIVRKNAFNARGHFLGAVSDSDLSSMYGVTDADAAAIVNGNPACAAGSVEHGVEHRPVGDRVGSVAHTFGFAIGRSDGAAVEMVAADDDGCFQFAARDEVIHRYSEFVALAITEPADPCGQSLEVNAFLRELDPATERFVLWKHFEDELIGTVYVRRLAGKSGPAERSAAFAK